jgi:hypothetical protein
LSLKINEDTVFVVKTYDPASVAGSQMRGFWRIFLRSIVVALRVVAALLVGPYDMFIFW